MYIILQPVKFAPISVCFLFFFIFMLISSLYIYDSSLWIVFFDRNHCLASWYYTIRNCEFLDAFFEWFFCYERKVSFATFSYKYWWNVKKSKFPVNILYYMHGMGIYTYSKMDKKILNINRLHENGNDMTMMILRVHCKKINKIVDRKNECNKKKNTFFSPNII